MEFLADIPRITYAVKGTYEILDKALKKNKPDSANLISGVVGQCYVELRRPVESCCAEIACSTALHRHPIDGVRLTILEDTNHQFAKYIHSGILCPNDRIIYGRTVRNGIAALLGIPEKSLDATWLSTTAVTANFSPKIEIPS